MVRKLKWTNLKKQYDLVIGVCKVLPDYPIKTVKCDLCGGLPCHRFTLSKYVIWHSLHTNWSDEGDDEKQAAIAYYYASTIDQFKKQGTEYKPVYFSDKFSPNMDSSEMMETVPRCVNDVITSFYCYARNAQKKKECHCIISLTIG